MRPVRPAGRGDSARLQEIERSAGELFREIGMPEVADDEPASIDELHEYADAGRAWVLVDDDDRAVGYVLVDVVDGNAHIEQISVHRDRQRRGYGAALVDHVAGWARERGMPAVTLTTFRAVPWNGPYYEHLGFRVMREDELTPELAARRDEEADRGLDPQSRDCMRLALN